MLIYKGALERGALVSPNAMKREIARAVSEVTSVEYVR